MDRRTFLTATGAAVAATTLARPNLARAAAPFEQPPLPYAEDALAPSISARTVGLHYGKHHKAYYDALNKLVPGTPYEAMSLEDVIRAAKEKDDKPVFNNAGQAWNHVFYWNQFKGGPAAPEGAFAEAVERDFGGADKMKEAMVKAGGAVFGSGWAWLVADGGKLSILSLPGGDNPIAQGKTPLAGIDVWEHAYYLDYQNRRPEHVKTVLDGLVNWRFVGEQMKA